MEIRLRRLRLKNFKGVKSFMLDTSDAERVSICGRNGSGKSTLADALAWLLFDKDAQGNGKFTLKPLDSSGQELHHLEHEVEVVIDVDGETLTLRKVMTEKWAKKRGNQNPEFGGHETAYYIHDVPRKQKEFQDEVAKLVREDLFRMLTSITHFNDMKWQSRRELLLEVAGDVSMADVIASNEGLARVPEVLNGRSYEDAVKILKGRRPKIAREIDEIGPRIDEVGREIPKEGEMMPPKTDMTYTELTSGLEKLRNERAAMLAGDTSSAKEEVLKLRERMAKIDGEYRAELQKAEEEKRKHRDLAVTQDLERQKVLNDQLRLENESKELLAKIEAKRSEWHEWHGKEPPAMVCQTCGQDLPADQAERIRANFRNRKAEAMKRISEEGKELGQRSASLSKQAAERRLAVTRYEQKCREAEQSSGSVVMPTPPDHGGILKLIEEIEAGAAGRRSQDTSEIDECMAALQADIDQHDLAARSRQTALRAEQRIAELKAEQQRLGQELDQIDADLSLLEAFVRTKVSKLEVHVAAKFVPLSFRLFEEQINGGLRETCETLIPSPDGALVPYSDANTGHRILAGIRIIEVLGTHFGIHVPVFVDGAESLTEGIPEIGSQVIRLVATPDETTGLTVACEELEALA